MSRTWRTCASKAAKTSSNVGERGRVARAGADVLARAHVEAVVQREFQHLHQVEVAGEDVGFLAERAHFDAARAAALARVLERLALAELFFDDGVGVEERREAVAVADDAQRVLQHRVGRLAGDLHVAARLQQVHLVDDVEQQVRHRVRAVAAVAQQAGEVDVGEVGERAAFGRRHADLRRRGVVVELDEEALEQLARGLARERAVGEARLVEGQEVLVEVSRAERVPAVQLGDDGEVAEPVHLQRLVEVARRVGRDPAADVGDLQQFRAPDAVLRRRGLRVGQVGVALREAHHRVAGDGHGPQLLALVEGLRVALEIEGRLRRRDVGFEVEHPLAVELAVGHGVAGRALLHELGEAARRVGVEPVLRQLAEHLVAQRAAAPEGDDLALVVVDDRRVDLVLRLRARVEDAQILGAVAGQLGIRRAPPSAAGRARRR